MIKILHILNSTKRDKKIVNLYNSVDEIENLFLINEENCKIKNSSNDFNFLKNSDSVFFYNHKSIPDLPFFNFNLIFVYGINKKQIEICFKFIKNVDAKIVWISLGGDIYSRAFINQRKLYQPETEKLLKKIGFLKNNIESFTYQYLKSFSYSTKFFRMVDFVSPRLDTEMHIINNHKFINAPYIRMPLGDNLERKKNKHTNINKDACDIYIGPSASPTSNHLDVFKKIKENNLKTNINVTLAYKINEKYQKEILKDGYYLFGDRFKPQTKFYSIDEFEAILDNCKVAIFNNERQEGLLTIATCAEKGMKVFLSENSPSYTYLKKSNYNIFSFQKEFDNFNLDSEESSKPLNVDNDNIFLFDEVKAIREALKFMLNSHYPNT